MENTQKLTENELELIELIRTAKDPAKAFEVAVTIILEFVKHNESKHSA